MRPFIDDKQMLEDIEQEGLSEEEQRKVIRKILGKYLVK